MKPTLFIGSSTESLELAYAVQEELEHDADPTVWTQGIFKPSSNALDDLIASASRFDFALFIFSPDDELVVRDAASPAVRDNVLFELGLFIGRIGRRRVFFLVPRGADLHIASDLLGVAPLSFSANRSDGNVRAALGPACNRIRRILQEHAKLPLGPRGASPSHSSPRTNRNFSAKRHAEIEKTLVELHRMSSAVLKPVLLFGDLDGFTGIAKWFGDDVADAVTNIVSEITKEVAARHYWTRLGGDQFLVCLTEIDNADAQSIAAKLVDRVALHDWSAIVPNLYVYMSVGVAPFKLHEDIQEWIVRAINGSILAKKMGGNRAQSAPLALPRGASKNVQDLIS